jgi:bifunctional non-homologous end joining protein LigD
MARSVDLESPQMVVFDLDPGEGTTIVECAALALRIREMLDAIGLVCLAKTSGSKGMQVYVPLNAPHTHEQAADFALAVAQVLERAEPTKVTTTMAKAVRPGRVFVDWSQNSRHKTTVCVYCCSCPTSIVSTPVWDEVADAAGHAAHLHRRVLAVDRDGDPFAAAVGWSAPAVV